MDVNITLLNQVTHVAASEATETRTVQANYLDNRTVVEDVFWTEGSVTLGNPSEKTRRISYRWEVDLPVGQYVSSDERICVGDAKAVYEVNEIVAPGGSVKVDWNAQVTVDQFGDLDNDGVIGGSDLGLLIAHWGNPWSPEDLGALLANWNGA